MPVGYDPFPGKPDPWPNDQIIQDPVAYLAAFRARYGRSPGNPSVPEGIPVPGYTNDMVFVNSLALKNAANAGEFGPAGVGQTPSIREETDLQYAHGRGDAFYYKWWWQYNDGGTPEKAIHITNPERAHGLFSLNDGAGQAHFPTFYFNDYDGPIIVPPPPPPVDPLPPAVGEAVPADIAHALDVIVAAKPSTKLGLGRYTQAQKLAFFKDVKRVIR